MKQVNLHPHTFLHLGSLLLMIYLLATLSGCQIFSKKATPESSLDAQLAKTEPPTAQIPMANGEPQKGFEQEPKGEPNS